MSWYVKGFEEILEWISISKPRISAYRFTMRVLAVAMFCWALHVAWPMLTFRSFPHVRWQDYGAMLILMLARLFLELANLFHGTDGGGHHPGEPAPWPQTPEILNLEYKSDKVTSMSLGV